MLVISDIDPLRNGWGYRHLLVCMPIIDHEQHFLTPCHAEHRAKPGRSRAQVVV